MEGPNPAAACDSASAHQHADESESLLDAAGLLRGDEMLRAGEALGVELDTLSVEELAAEILDAETRIRRLRARQIHALGRLETRHESDGPLPLDDHPEHPAAFARVATWYTAQTRLDPTLGAARTKTASDLLGLPIIAAAFAAGLLDETHVARIRRLYRRDRAATRAAQHALVAWALGLEWRDFTDAVDALTDLLDRRDPTDRALKDFDARGVSATRHGGRASAVFDTTSDLWSLIEDRIAPEIARMHDADWAEAKARCGDDVTGADLARTHRQRKHDALTEAILRGTATTSGEDSAFEPARPVASFETVVAVDYDTLQREIERLAIGTVEVPSIDDALDAALRRRCHTEATDQALSPWFAARAAIAGQVRRLIVDGNDARLSPKAELFAGLTLRAVLLRDRRCTTPGCDVPAHLCEVDHVVPRFRRGPTEVENGKARCRRCHQWKTLLDLLGFP